MLPPKSTSLQMRPSNSLGWSSSISDGANPSSSSLATNLTRPLISVEVASRWTATVIVSTQSGVTRMSSSMNRRISWPASWHPSLREAEVPREFEWW